MTGNTDTAAVEGEEPVETFSLRRSAWNDLSTYLGHARRLFRRDYRRAESTEGYVLDPDDYDRVIEAYNRADGTEFEVDRRAARVLVDMIAGLRCAWKDGDEAARLAEASFRRVENEVWRVDEALKERELSPAPR